MKSHDSVGETERYHAYLQNIFDHFQHERPSPSEIVGFQLAVNASNGTAGQSRFISTLLVFEVVLRIPTYPQELSSLHKRLKILHNAYARMTKIMAEAV